eukprot:2420053-Rhodomonas_salina.3
MRDQSMETEGRGMRDQGAVTCCLLPGTDLAYGYQSMLTESRGHSPVSCPCYAMSDTGISYAAICLCALSVLTERMLLAAYARAIRCPWLLLSAYALATDLKRMLLPAYAMSGTDLWCVLLPAYAMSGTDLWRVLLPGEEQQGRYRSRDDA